MNRVDSAKALNSKPTCGKCGTALPLHGLATEVSLKGFKKIVASSDKPVIVDFWASWCGPCKMYSPIFERASAMHADATYLKVNTEANPALSSEFGIRSIPMTIVFKNGREFRREAGVIPEEMIPKLYG
jgi:thioredoxin 2